MDTQKIVIIAITIVLIMGIKTFIIKKQSPPEEILSNSSKLIASNEIIGIDVRTESEVRANPSPGAKNIPSNRINSELPKLDPKKTYFLFCESGARASGVLSQFKKAGLNKVYNIGSWRDWKEMAK